MQNNKRKLHYSEHSVLNIMLSLAFRSNKNLFCRELTNVDTLRTPKNSAQVLAMSLDLVSKIFIIAPVTANCNSLMLDLDNGHTSIAYNNIGKHFLDNSSIITFSRATRPTFPKIALKAL